MYLFTEFRRNSSKAFKRHEKSEKKKHKQKSIIEKINHL